MGDIQRVTIEGKVYVILSEEDYKGLVDGQTPIEARAARTESDEESWPTHVLNALVNGENPIRVYRTYRGLTVSELARKTELSQSYISEIEGSKKPGSVDALKRIAAVLTVDLNDLT